MKRAEQFLENIIFMSRWIQVPIYLGLIVGCFVYCYKFMQELFHLVSEVGHLTEEMIMIGILSLVDISMVVNLIIIVVIGGYSTFVSKLDFGEHEDKPEWLEEINAGTLKVKLAISLVGVSSIHLLKTFININDSPNEKVMLQVLIHFLFLLSGLFLAFTDKILHGTHAPSKRKAEH